ncbi:MAG: conjugal transfer protein TraF [Planctomycetes bacterium]|nr:conjugal transfer protein TraF [Planctomycetota bacterium]
MKPTLVMAAVSLLAASAVAAPQQTDGARNSAMGGTGVASSDYLNAAFVNPAMMTEYSIIGDDDWALLLPTIGVLASDPDSLLDDLEDFTDAVDAIDDAFSTGVPTQGQLDSLADSLSTIGGKSLYAGFDAGLALAIPSQYFSTALIIDSYLDVQTFLSIDGTDDAAIRGALSGTSLPDLGSEAVAIGANVTQVGLAFAKKFDIGPNGLSLGFTPKVQRIEVLNIAVGLDDDADDISDDFSESKYRSDDTAVNFDLGAAFHASENWTFGLAVRDVMGSDLASKTTSGRTFTYDLSPVVTAGAAYNGETITVAADVDLTQHERFGRGDESQFLRVGAEAGWEWAQFRVGYQMDIEDGTNDIATAGIGFSPFGVLHMDLAAAAGDETYGAVLSISFTF